MITLHDIKQARHNIKDIVRTTPLITSTQLSTLCQNELYLKGEHLQTTGSFKIRGATNKVKQVIKDGATFVTTASSGNHGQAVAYIANKLQIPATIVVPEDVTPIKRKAIEAYNGHIEMCGTTSPERIERAYLLANENKGVFIPPYDDPYVMAGQGTIGLEILDQLDDVDIVIVPVGGGGLMSGILTAIKETNPKIKVIGVEPDSANDTYLSLEKGEIVSIPPTTTIADGLRTSAPGDLTFPILQKYLDDLVLVTEDDIRSALTLVLERTKQLIEPSSATTIAALLNGSLNITNKKIVTVISGGNVAVQQLNRLIK